MSISLHNKIVNYSFKCSVAEKQSYKDNFKNGEFSQKLRALLRLYIKDIRVREMVAQELYEAKS